MNDFLAHLIISKWLRKQNCRQKRKSKRQKDIKAKKEIAYEKFFHLFKYTINHDNVRFFFSVSI